MHAGELFVCVCCNEESPQQDASYDDQYAGPVCETCRRNSKWAQAWLKRGGIVRPMVKSDINQFNFKRFKL